MSSRFTIDEIAARLGAGASNPRPVGERETDPIGEQMMKLDVRSIRLYEYNPRLMRNPLYDEIKESIRERGLENPLIVTIRPGESHYIVARGGNTRLQILQELQSENPGGGFDQVLCLITPWVSETQTLTSHLIENEQRSPLTFIEKALAVEKLQKLYEAEEGHALSQPELSKRLSRDGVGVSQPVISRIKDTLRFLLPAIPTVLHQGLKAESVKKLVILHNDCERAWNEFAHETKPQTDFDAFHLEILSKFNVNLEDFSLKAVRDALVGGMIPIFGKTYALIESVVRKDEIALQMRKHFLSRPAQKFELLEVPSRPELPVRSTPRHLSVTPATAGSVRHGSAATHGYDPARALAPGQNKDTVPNRRLSSIHHMIKEQIGIEAEGAKPGDGYVDGFTHDPLPATGVWEIDPEEDERVLLRAQIAQLAAEIAKLTEPEARIFITDQGVGYEFRSPGQEIWDRWSASSRMTMLLLRDFSGWGKVKPIAQLGGLLCGVPSQEITRVRDEVFCRLIRLMRLLRRLMEHVNASCEAWESEESVDPTEPDDG